MSFLSSLFDIENCGPKFISEYSINTTNYSVFAEITQVT